MRLAEIQNSSILFCNGGRQIDLKDTFQRILITTDGSKCSQNAVLQGMELAKLIGAKVYALYVLNKDAYVPPVMETPIQLGSNWNVIEETLRQEGDEAIQYAKKVAEDKEIDYEGVVIEGDPASEILKFAEQNKIDLIVMGTFGKGRLERSLLGSVTDKVVRHSNTSVLVIKKQKQN